MQTSVLFETNYKAKEKIIVNQGGTSSGKTVCILQVLAIHAISTPELIITVCGQDIPNLKRGALRDFQLYVLCEDRIRNEIANFNKSERIFTFKNGSIIEFESYEDEQDAKNGKRDYLFLNEAQGTPYNVFKQLQMRTKVQTFIDYNPSAEFWVHEKILTLPDTERRLIISDYRHNPFCPPSIIENILALKDIDPELWKVYGRGLTGKIEGLIYPKWTLVDAIPEGEYVYGLDFGYNHPTALIRGVVNTDTKSLYLEEVVYESRLITSELVDRMEAQGVSKRDTIYADAARPETIEEISRAGYNIVKADKAVWDGINKMKSFNIYVTKSSHNLIKELRSYKWKMDKSGKSLEEPVKFLDDALDAARYLVWNATKENKFDYSW